jgi:hypothetical protein
MTHWKRASLGSQQRISEKVVEKKLLREPT